MDNFREWLSDNLRYILLILIIAAVCALGYFGIKFIGSRTANKPADEVVSETSEVASETETEPAVEAPESKEEVETGEEKMPGLSEDIPEGIKTSVGKYFEAAGTGDIELLKSVVDELSPEDEQAFLEGGKTVYSDVKIMSKPGLTDDAKALFVTYNYMNEQEGVTLPGLSTLYVAGAENKIKTKLSAEEENYLSDLEKNADVMDLISRTRTAYVDAIAKQAEEAANVQEDPSVLESDGNAAPAEEQSAEQETQNTEQPAQNTEEQTQNTEQPAPAAPTATDGFTIGGTYTVSPGCNVRPTPDYENEPLGVIEDGTTVEYLGTQNGWYHVKGGGYEGYIGPSFLK